MEWQTRYFSWWWISSHTMCSHIINLLCKMNWMQNLSPYYIIEMLLSMRSNHLRDGQGRKVCEVIIFKMAKVEISYKERENSNSYWNVLGYPNTVEFNILKNVNLLFTNWVGGSDLMGREECQMKMIGVRGSIVSVFAKSLWSHFKGFGHVIF